MTFKKGTESIIDEDIITFKIGTKVKEYYIIPKEVFNIKNDLYIKNPIILNDIGKIIINQFNNIFQLIEKARNNDAKISIGNEKDTILTNDFLKICKSFPNSYEKELYYSSIVETCLENFFDDLIPFEEKFNKYINNKKRNNKKLLTKVIYENDLNKFYTIRTQIEDLLNHENTVSEEQWKVIIADIILLLFPEYINYHREFQFKLKKNDRDKAKEQIDFILVKANGCIDVLEVKKSNCSSLISPNKDRKNYYATPSLSKVSMQTEKYIYNIMRNSLETEVLLDKKYGAYYDIDFNFRIINPKGIIIAGRKNGLNKEQINDFEVIKKMYSNIISIYTYDDILEMLDRQIEMIKKKID